MSRKVLISLIVRSDNDYFLVDDDLLGKAEDAIRTSYLEWHI